ncbi:hypothetical protein Z043_112230 [Scleropages formosus]|uniref:PDZ domain-containing protein n=1 Tax=Scleropages formosus TaxID=113540 RepID=A0A0P7X4W0_SCLFO|nr:hypothetical protein Z043_112230 [Scleropages formosus]
MWRAQGLRGDRNRGRARRTEILGRARDRHGTRRVFGTLRANGQRAQRMAAELQPRLCCLTKGPGGYGFHLHGEKGRTGQYIRRVEPNSPAEAAGLRAGDRVLEVVQRIRAVEHETRLLVVDPVTDEHMRRLRLSGSGPLPLLSSASPSKPKNGHLSPEPVPPAREGSEPTAAPSPTSRKHCGASSVNCREGQRRAACPQGIHQFALGKDRHGCHQHSLGSKLRNRHPGPTCGRVLVNCNEGVSFPATSAAPSPPVHTVVAPTLKTAWPEHGPRTLSSTANLSTPI